MGGGVDKLNPNISGEKESALAARIGGDVKTVVDPVIDAVGGLVGGVGWLAANWQIAIIGALAVVVILRK